MITPEQRSTLIAGTFGSIVAYEDQANPRTEYRIEEQMPSGAYRLSDPMTGELVVTDLRQYGWSVVPTLPADAWDAPAGAGHAVEADRG